MRQAVECDVCIIGSGITAAMIAHKLSDEREANIVVVEAGGASVPFAGRTARRARYLAYGENPWSGDHIDDQNALGVAHGFSPSMQVGGLAMHWGGVTPRFSPEDFRVRSLYGVGDDWPLSYDDLDPYYQEAEERLGVSGEQGPPELDPRSRPYPMPPLPLSYSLEQLRKWGAAAGIPFWSQPSAKNSVPYAGRAVCARCDTCFPVCPTGAKYSPDFTFDALVRDRKIRLLTSTLVRRLVAEPGSARIEHAVAVRTDAPDTTVELRAKLFVLAAGFTWSPHLLLLSADSRFPNGIANRSGTVGRYLNGHRNVGAQIRLPLELFPGMNQQHSLCTKKYMRPGRLTRYVRHDLRIWESTTGRDPRLADDSGRVLIGDEVLDDWRARSRTGAARVRAYYDVLPHRDSALTLDAAVRNRWGDPMPRLTFRDSEESVALRAPTEDGIKRLFQHMARAGGGEIITMRGSDAQEHPGGGCRMGDDPATSVCDGFGQAHDHENLFVAGAPTSVTGGCANATLTFAALGLRSAARIGERLPARASPLAGAAASR